jgi:hypothetical protein
MVGLEPRVVGAQTGQQVVLVPPPKVLLCGVPAWWFGN